MFNHLEGCTRENGLIKMLIAGRCGDRANEIRVGEEADGEQCTVQFSTINGARGPSMAEWRALIGRLDVSIESTANKLQFLEI